MRMPLLHSVPLSIKSAEEYRRYVETFGKLPTRTFNEISGYVESEDRGLYLLLMPPGSGKTFLLYQLREEFYRQGPILLNSFGGSLERFQEFVNALDAELARAVAAWINVVTGRSIQSIPDVLTIAGAVAIAANANIPLILLLDEVPLSEESGERFKALVSNFESLLRRVDGLGGFKVHILLTSHAVSADLSEKLFDELRARGGLQRFSVVRPFTKMELAPGFEAEATGFVKRLVGGAPLDPLVLRTAVEMLKRGFVFRQLVTFMEGTKRRARFTDLERDLHKAIVEKLREELRRRGIREGKLEISSRPDLVLADGTCIEVKVRAGIPEVNPLQHAECAKRLYIIVSLETVNVPGAQIVHIKADVERIVSALDTLRSREGREAYRGALAILAEATAASALEKLVPQPQAEQLDPRMRFLCSKLGEFFKEERVATKSDIAHSASFKQILKEIADVAPEELKAELENCLKMKKPRVSCVDTLAKVIEKVYGKTALKVEGSKVTLGPLCSKR